jgi:hypothetical protein
MSDETISPLRRRMIEDMTVRGFGEKTRNAYVRHVRTFAAFIGRSPETATAEEVRRFQLHQTETGVGAPSINSAVSALRFLPAVPVHRDARAAGSRPPAHGRAPAAPAAARAERGGGRASARGGAGTEEPTAMPTYPRRPHAARPFRWSASRNARAMIIIVGEPLPGVGNTELPAM